MFTKACEYAIRAVLFIAMKSVDGSRLGIPEIARAIDSPVPFTAKILQTLVRKKIISSIKGPNGGFYLDPKAKPIPINAVVKAIDGDDVLSSCALGLKKCSDSFLCPVHHEVKLYKDKLKEVFKDTSIQSAARDVLQGKAYLKNYNPRSSR